VKSATRERLIEAALEQVSRAGYLGASTRKIAARAGVAEVTLFRKFGSKQALFAAMLERHAFGEELRELLRQRAKEPVRDVLARVGLGFLGNLREREALVRITLAEASRYPAAVRTTTDRFIRDSTNTLARFLAWRMREGELRPVGSRPVARAYLGALFSHFISEVIIAGRRPSRRAERRLVDACVDVFLEGLWA